jgi:tetratricopeptide (TPR) repeat protein
VSQRAAPPRPGPWRPSLSGLGRAWLAAVGLGLGLGLGVAAAHAATPAAWAAPTEVPARDSEVVEVLRERPLTVAERQARALRAQLRAQPRSLHLATQVAWQALQQARRDGDPRLLGQAQAALAPWWALPAPPPEVRLLRATVLQSTHDFSAALRDLQALVKLPHASPQAWLTLASVLQVTGRYDEAQAACESLRATGEPEAVVLAAACTLELQSLKGQADQARDGLQALSQRAPAALQPQLQLMRAELAERMGQPQQALALYQALLLQQDDAYLLGNLADLLLELGRPAEVITLLQGRERNDALLLRLAEAGVAMAAGARPPPAVHAQIAALKARFDAARLRGDSVHRREEARLALRLLKQPPRALQLARANWRVQKEPADARILLEAARAAHDVREVAALRTQVQDWGWRDQRLEAMW